MTRQAVGEIESVVEKLNERIRMLESRVSALEGAPQKKSSAEPKATVAVRTEQPAETWQGFPSVRLPGVVSTLGKAVLGMAGAYLLRAIAESSAIPKLPVIILAVVYAALWMILAVRAHSDRFASVTFAITSTLILSPMLWESTVRFQFLSPAFTGVILVGFFVMTLGLAWQRDLEVIPWLAALATLVTALALIMATHAIVPLTVAILAVALSVEIAACFGHRLSLRAVPAIAADIAVWLLVYLMTSASGVPEGYHATAPATVVTLWSALIVIYLGSIGIRSFWLRQRVTFVDVGQGALALMIAGFGALRSLQGLIAPALGACFLILAAVCYWGALSRFAEESYAFNRRVSATWAAILLIAGGFLVFPVNIQVVFLCMAAVAATFEYMHSRKLSLGIHASLFLAAGAAVSGLPNYVENALAGAVPAGRHWAVVFMAGSAALCYLIGSRLPEPKTRRRTLWIFPAALVGFAGAALAVAAIVWLASGRLDLSASRLSVIRTVVICALALSLGVVGLRWRRIELRWVAYIAVAFGTLKLMFEDLRYGNAASLVVSLLFYGLILIVLPRLTRREGAVGIP